MPRVDTTYTVANDEEPDPNGPPGTSVSLEMQAFYTRRLGTKLPSGDCNSQGSQMNLTIFSKRKL